LASSVDTSAIRRALQGDLESAVRIVTEDLVGEAQRQAPRDEGTLAGTGSGQVEVIGNRVTGRVTFDTPYAKRQHEELTWNHPKGGNAKYLEGPLTNNAAKYEAVIAAVIKRRLRAGRS
jgi:hypothetical protein